MKVYMCVCLYTYTYVHVSIYIYRERERERGMLIEQCSLAGYQCEQLKQ